MENQQQTYVAFVRGINVGGRKKVPMAELRQLLEREGFSGVKTLLNSGNLIFSGGRRPVAEVEEDLSGKIEERFGFPVPVIARTAGAIREIINHEPFQSIEVNKNTRLYLSFLRQHPENPPALPWRSEDGSFEILEFLDNTVCSVLDVSRCKTPDAMGVLEKFYGKDITTRNWNTMLKIADKL